MPTCTSCRAPAQASQRQPALPHQKLTFIASQLTKVMTNEQLEAQIKKLEAQNEQLLKALRNSKADPEVMTKEKFKAEVERLKAESMQIAFKKAEDHLMTSNELKAEIEKIKSENVQLAKDAANARTALRRAKNPQPVERPSVKRILSIVNDAYMSLKQLFNGFKLVKGKGRVPKCCGWELSMGNLKRRRFHSLKEIWELLTQEEWFLSDIFPPVSNRVKRLAPRLPFRHPVLVPRLRDGSQFSHPIPAPG